MTRKIHISDLSSLLAWSVVLLFTSQAALAQKSLDAVYSAVTTANPLKGFMPFSGKYDKNDLPYSMEFFYIPLKDIMVGKDHFAWSKLDSQLDEIAGRGRQAVFRVALDYPQQASGVPDFLRDGPDGIRGNNDDLLMRGYDDFGNQGKSLAPNYSDPNLRAALIHFIQALGTRYDGDPRIGFIQLGLLGFWGEWHTFPYIGGQKPDWSPSAEVQEQVLAAFDRAFSRTLLLAREPKHDFFKKYQIGYHDDSFAYQTLAPPNWHYQAKLTEFGETERWRTQPIGGEVRPEIQPEMWSRPSVVPAGQEYTKCVAALHPSWMLAHGAFENKLNSTALKCANEQSRQLGYEFFITRAQIEANSAKESISIRASLRNTGVAPFYYDWPLEMAVVDSDMKTVYECRPKWSLTQLLPGDPDRDWAHEIPAGTLTYGKYHLLIRVLNPLKSGMPLRFANTTQDRDRQGWLTLGLVNVKAED
jgi:Domain of unknown function (DUF4832)